jgi:uncharacterized protein YbaA (DUF1428 family)
MKDAETVVFSYIVYKSRAERDRVNKLVMADPRLNDMMQGKDMPFDAKRMIYGGFKEIVGQAAGETRPARKAAPKKAKKAKKAAKR